MRPDEDWEIDHPEPWRITHRTNIYELQATHRRCNREKGGKVDFEIRRVDQLRKGQLRAIDKLETRVGHDDTTAIELPCRYGKSDTMRVAALKLWALGRVCTTLVLSPAENLRDQMGSLWRWNKMLKMYGIHCKAQLRINTITKAKAGELCSLNPNGEVFISSTIHLVQMNLDLFVQWVDSEVHRTGLPVLIFIDECHTGSTTNKWGEIVPKLTAAGAHVGLLTATPERADGYRIPGFRFTEVDEGDVTVWRSRPHDEDPDMTTVEKYEGRWTKLRLEADTEVSFREAWEEKAEGQPIICKVSWIPFDPEIKLTDADGGETTTWLSEVTDPREVRKYLGRAVREKNAIQKAVKMLIACLRDRRALNPGFTAVVFGGSDIGEGNERSENKHLEAIRAEIKRQWPPEWPAPKVLIAASTETSDGGKSIIESFAGTDAKPGEGDVLLLKQMAGMGTDFPWVKTVVDLSPTRTYATSAQRWLRGGTPCGGAVTFDLITPVDVISRLFFNKLVRDQGGEAKMTDMTLTDQYDKRREERTPNGPLITVGDVRDGEFSDSDGRTADSEQWDKVTRLISLAPRITSVYSHAEIAELAESWAAPDDEAEADDSSTARDTSADAAMLRGQINQVHKQVAVPRYMRICQEHGIAITFGRAAEYVFGQAKRDAGWPIGVKLDEWDDLDDLSRLLDAMKLLCVYDWQQDK
jgi:hypothetical protein